MKQESLCSQCTSQVWKTHIQDQETLDKYSESMKQLATSYWESSGEESRVQWVKSQVSRLQEDKHMLMLCFRWNTISGEVVKKEKHRKTRNGYGGPKGILEKWGQSKNQLHMETAIWRMKYWVKNAEKMEKGFL